MPFWSGPALSAPWWISRIAQFEIHIEALRSAGGVDPDSLVAPRELWPSHKHEQLERWFEDRRDELKQRDKDRERANG